MAIRTLCLTLSVLLIPALLAGSAAAGASSEDAARQALAVLRTQPDDTAARERLRRAFTEVYPARLPADVVAHLPVPHQRCEDAVLSSAPAQRSFYTNGLAFPDASHRRDPEGRQRFNRVLHGYIEEPGEGEWRLRFRVLYSHADPGAEELAPRVMRLALRVFAAHAAVLGSGQKALARPVDIWLRGDGEGGAEQSGSSLYLLGTGRKRDPVELLRQVAHEFGHLALPAVGPLSAPEPWGNGFLGEALYLRWLAQVPAGDDLPVSGTAVADYVRRELDPLAQSFADRGWEALAAQEGSAEGLRLFLGMVLRLEQTQGPTAVARLVRIVRGPALRDWAAGARTLMPSAGR